MTKKELLAKNPKLEELDQIISKRANTPSARKLVEEKIRTDFGATATFDEIVDLFEYYDVMTNDATMVGSKLFDSTLFEPIKELAISYRKDLDDVTNGLVKGEVVLGKVLGEARYWKMKYLDMTTNYAGERREKLRTEKEVYELMNKVAGLETTIQEKDKLLNATSLSSRQKAEHVVAAEKEARNAKAGAEAAIEKSKEWEKAVNDLKTQLEVARKANAASQKILYKKDHEIAGLTKKIKGKNIAIGVLAGFFGVTALTLVGHEVYHHTQESKQDNVNVLDVGELQGRISNTHKIVIDLGDSVVTLTNMSHEAAEASKEALAAEDMDNVTIKDAYDRANEASAYAVTTLNKVNSTLEDVKADQIAVVNEDNFDALLGYMDKNNTYISSMAEWILDAGKVVGEARTTLETANAVAKADLQDKINALEATVATVTAERDELATINQELQNEVASWKSEIANTFDYMYDGYTYQDFTVEEYNIKSFSVLDESLAAIPMNETGKAAYDADNNAEVKAAHFGTKEQLQMMKGMGALYNAAESEKEEQTTPQGNENGESEVVENNDEGKTPSDPTGEQNHTDNPNADENQNGDTTPAGTEIVDDDQPGDDEQPGNWGNGNGRG